jgi:multiple sugar transport system substrate-binding protein
LRSQAVIFAAILAMVPLRAESADLVVWWDKAYYPREDVALAALIRDFEQKSGVKVELVRYQDIEVPEKIEAAIVAGRPPDFLFSLEPVFGQVARWANENRLVELTNAIGGAVDLFDKDLLDLATFTIGDSGRTGIYALPTGRSTVLLHVWLSLLERAGFRREDIPTEWEPFWAFWCDKVQPAVRKALGREDIWGIGAPMSAKADDTRWALLQFIHAYTAEWPAPTGPSLLRDPAAGAALIKGLAGYTAIYKQGCTPPDSVDWTDTGNNQAFLSQRTVMTANLSLSIAAALKEARPDDYARNAITIGWPHDAYGGTEHILGNNQWAVVFKDGGNTAGALQLVQFLAGGGLELYLTDAGDRLLPPSRKLLEYPFWLDPTDPHRLRAAVQVARDPHVYGNYGLGLAEEVRLERAGPLRAFGEAVYRVVVDGLTPEQAADELIAKIKAELGSSLDETKLRIWAPPAAMLT